uniref:Uncharacterized protein n=1 Tax=Plectus sambesii TaxID=2011161 RepID=A0A914X7B4_9BILA
MAAVAEMHYFAAVFDRNMSIMYHEAKKLLKASGEEFPQGTGVMILTEDPAHFDDFNSDAYEVIEQTIGLSDEEPQYSDDEDAKYEKVTNSHETSSRTSQQQAEDDLIARALRQLTEAKEKAAEAMVADITFTNSGGPRDQLTQELDHHLQHSTLGVQMAIDEFGERTQTLSRDQELPYEDARPRNGK